MSEYVKKNMKVKKMSDFDITHYSLEFLKQHNVKYVVSDRGTVVKIDLDSLTEDTFNGEHIGTTKNEDIFKKPSIGWTSFVFFPCKLLSKTPKYINKEILCLSM